LLKASLKLLLKLDSLWKNSTLREFKTQLGEVKHFSNSKKKSIEISLVVASECEVDKNLRENFEFPEMVV